MRLIDADKFEAYCTKTPEWVADDPFRAYVDGMTQVLEEIDRAPTVDAVPVVRCQECKHGYPLGLGEYTPYIYCVKPYAGNWPTHKPDWYCADGKKKEDDNENHG